MESYLLFTLFYILFSACFIFPPSEFVSLGLTVESLFSNWVKNEADCFIHHHIRRTVATLMTHSCIPLGYLAGVKYLLPNASIWEGNLLWNLYVVTSITLPFLALITIWNWYEQNWRNHPIAKNLMYFTTAENNINRIAMDIDNEYRRVDKIIIRCNPVIKVVATDNWIIKISPYKLNFAHQSDATLVVVSSDTHVYIPGRPEGGQFLNIEVKPNRPNVPCFQIRINSVDFKDLQDKMIRPIRILENVVVHKTLIDSFLDAFKEQVAQNPELVWGENLDVCIGCMASVPNVKLYTSCGDHSGQNKCTMCYCKPLWCIDCMGKWFASRQDQDRPETWLSSKCSCPMCRSIFCILDVCPIVPSSNLTSNS